MEPGAPPPAEPGAPPPTSSVDEAVPEYSGDAEGMASASFWDSMAGITIAGKTVTPEQAKQIIYVGGAALIVMVITLIAVLTGGSDDAAGSDAPVPTSTGASMATDWGGMGPPPPAGHAAVGYTAKLSAEPAVGGTTTVNFGTECAMLDPSPSACGGFNEARCGVTDNGELFAVHSESCAGDAMCSSADGPVRLGPPVRYGCSRTPETASGAYVECCVAVDSDTACPMEKTDTVPACSGSSGSHSSMDVMGMSSCCSSQVCECEGEINCVVQTDATFAWEDIVTDGTGTQITEWEQNADDGWFHLDLPFEFHWFGNVETTITIGTNGVLTFGQAQLHNGASEPVPCNWQVGGAIEGGEASTGCVGNNYGGSGTANGSPDGVIAPFWADLTNDGDLQADEGVFYKVISIDDDRLAAWNKLIIEWKLPVWNAAGTMCHFEVILMGDGTVVMQYEDMAVAIGDSWSHESIGFEDQSGSKGVQISYGAIPRAGTAYVIPPSCHVNEGETSNTCCTDQMCQCEGVQCSVTTDAEYDWVDIVTDGTGTQITEWEQNADDGWFHLDLPFEFHWFGNVETTITIGTNGVLTFGQAQLHNGASEPVPCNWQVGAATQDGEAAAGCVGVDYGSSGNANGSPDGVIAPFWADLTSDGDLQANEGVFFKTISVDDPRLAAWNKLIIEWKLPVWNAAGTMCHFEVILMGDGTVVMQYEDMAVAIGDSWSHESIGFEDQSGSKGVQISYGAIPPAHTAYEISPMCHMLEHATSTCCTSRMCACEGLQAECTVETDAAFDWVDIISGAGTQITEWEQNADDGWFHLDLPFEFHWFGNVETTITIGTNGVLTFGQAQLHNGASEPVPCNWQVGAATQDGEAAAGCVGVDYGSSGNANGSPDGVIAPFWADLTSDGDLQANEGVYYQIIQEDDPHLAAWNRLVVEWNIPVWNVADSTCHFETILMGDGTVLLQYQDMAEVGDSWSHESIGFEDQSGSKGVQISYGVVPPPGTAYQISPMCHMLEGGAASTCCSSRMCQCENVDSCTIETDYTYRWVDIIDSGTGTQIMDEDWDGTTANFHADDGWFHLPLPFEFNWFGTPQRLVTIGTNGVLTFGTEQLPNGASEPVPCSWDGAGVGSGRSGEGDGSNGCVGNNYGGSGLRTGVSPDGVIAPFWADLTAESQAAPGASEGVYYQIISDPSNPVAAMNKLIVEYNVPICTCWSASSEGHEGGCWTNPECGVRETHENGGTMHFQIILMGDGSVLMQYKDMPTATGSWSHESIGFEDHSGSTGVQIMYGAVPGDHTAYYIPPSCHGGTGCSAFCEAMYSGQTEPMYACRSGCSSVQSGGLDYLGCQHECASKFGADAPASAETGCSARGNRCEDPCNSGCWLALSAGR